eukprot:CAMPEP_0181311480 /NCGR_PEP_ID=MMETSP1101-20121128/13159_1 /TAXON_ID=46948 /ORGANISM="Rhodomonas abbreviata, Strain Caron Lab Isolate" /LENGTH=89 /DNA_ID=CAMNT_0023418213 /DNA_START=15 /DNA_END=284 /DNA_ORIENTATION=-
MAEDGTAIVESISSKLKETLKATHVEVKDLSDGCGAKLDIIVVSDEFEGKPLLERQRSVHEAIKEEMKVVHAITMKTKTVKQWEAMQQA